MQVTIFELIGVDSKKVLLEQLFSKSLFPAVSIDREEFPPVQGMNQAWRYLKLLQAAIPPEQGITLSLDEFSASAYRIYIKAYFSMTTSYWNNTRGYAGGDLLDFFPAVSVHDRMVLVPLGLRKKLARSNEELPTFPALKSGGVLEVDFNDESAVRVAVTQVADRLHTDFLKELQTYASYQDLRDVPLQKIADDLNADLGYLQHLLKGDEHAFERASYQHLEWTLSPTDLQLGRWTKVQLGVKNNSDQDIKNLLIQIRGPVKIRPDRIELNVSAKSSAITPVAIMPEESGEFPIEIVGVLPQDKFLAEWLRPFSIWLNCT